MRQEIAALVAYHRFIYPRNHKVCEFHTRNTLVVPSVEMSYSRLGKINARQRLALILAHVRAPPLSGNTCLLDAVFVIKQLIQQFKICLLFFVLCVWSGLRSGLHVFIVFEEFDLSCLEKEFSWEKAEMNIHCFLSKSSFKQCLGFRRHVKVLIADNFIVS